MRCKKIKNNNNYIHVLCNYDIDSYVFIRYILGYMVSMWGRGLRQMDGAIKHQTLSLETDDCFLSLTDS